MKESTLHKEKPLKILREALECRISQSIDFNAHALILEMLRKEESHSIIVTPWDMSIECNCVMYALGLLFEPASSPMGRYYANTTFVQNLIETGLIAENMIPAEGDLVVYYKERRVAHIGIFLHHDRVRSKWGIGHLYEHETWEVPSTYGDEIRRFSPIDPEVAMGALRKFNSV